MSSLRLSGWKEEDCVVELKEIIDTFKDMTIDGMSKLNREDIQSALSGVSLMYLTYFNSPFLNKHYKNNPNIKKEAFKVGEILEYVQQGGFSYARHLIQDALFEELDETSPNHHTFAAEQIMSFYENLFETKGFQTCRFTRSTWNSKYGNVSCFLNLKIECYEDREMLEALLLANEIIKHPFDFIDCASSALTVGFSDIPDYLSFIAKDNFDTYLKSQINKDVIIEYREANEQIIELLK